MAILLTSAQMRAIEGAAIASGAVSGLELMERAGAGVLEALVAHWPDCATRPGLAVVLCGPGNNGGDGFVIARLLAKAGWEVRLGLLGRPDRLPPDARTNHDLWAALGAVQSLDDALAALGKADLAVDALFGTGLARPLEGTAARAANALAEMAWGGGRVLAVDAPSGLCMDSGRPLVPPEGDGVAAATLTVSFHALKAGHVLAEGPERCGRAVVADIGLTASQHRAALGVDGVQTLAAIVEPPDAGRLDKAAHPGAHKYGHGHALVLAGGAGKGGAARLAARAALRVGAGLVTLGVPWEAMAENAAQLTAIMLAGVDDAAALEHLLDDDRLNALALGPGLGRGRARLLVPVALAAQRPVVLDADALTAFADDPAALFAILHGKAVLTPHAGEFARLFPDIAAGLHGPARHGPAPSRLDAARAAAAISNAVVLLKGPDTVIATPEGRVAVNVAAYDRAAPWLATAGAGDVLTGLIAGLMARGFSAFAAAKAGAWLHTEAARAFGPGLIAEDLPEVLPAVLRGLIASGIAPEPGAAGVVWPP
ncbi:NAD(P)H-hydrate dehydratase [Maritimibacter sp. HL-12]|uniref:NAD(P)H-hydrate dehydratase n=1 Tax=Maritimibacter sp. HL-12 TaxID=1162418 RepID=UPI000A0F2AD3|nr:NAD(P)H-hydrate dehydratase [Maritimibacter sp. HL-12]SMH55549.1 yjeF C-terminal region, hydroxyethylthiazole kinase-related/yjeF N-terminal region [Maritimibacter sp. HL-12]